MNDENKMDKQDKTAFVHDAICNVVNEIIQSGLFEKENGLSDANETILVVLFSYIQSLFCLIDRILQLGGNNEIDKKRFHDLEREIYQLLIKKEIIKKDIKYFN